jgi:hypothetical protein
MEKRNVDPAAVLDNYRSLGFQVNLLSQDGRPRPASTEEVIAACEAWEGRVVNLVLTRH